MASRLVGTFRTVLRRVPFPSLRTQGLARAARGGGRGGKGVTSTSTASSNAVSTSPSPPPPQGAVPAAEEDPWVPVTDKSSGQIYYWNTQTNETTALGEPKPNAVAGAAQQQQQPSMMGGLAGVVAEGFAFGVGSSVARNVVGSFFGGGDDDHSAVGGDGSDGGDGDGDSWDI